MRLGKHEKGILALLRKDGNPQSAWQIAYHFFHAGRDEDERQNWPEVPRSFDVAIRRAIHSLQRKGLAHTGRTRYLWCWLPEHAPVDSRKRIGAAEVEAPVLELLAEKRDGARKSEWSSGDTYYRNFSKRVAKHLGEELCWGWLQVAVGRAVRRLIRRGIIEAEVYQSSTRDPGRTGIESIRLPHR